MGPFLSLTARNVIIHALACNNNTIRDVKKERKENVMIIYFEESYIIRLCNENNEARKPK